MKKNWVKPSIVNIVSSNVKGGTSTNAYPYEKYLSACSPNSAGTCIASYGGILLDYTTGAAESTVFACVNSAGTAVSAIGVLCAS